MNRFWLLTCIVAVGSMFAIPSVAAPLPPSQESVLEIQAILNSRDLQSRLGWDDTIQSIQRLSSGYQVKTASGCVLSVSVTLAPSDYDPSGELRLQFFPNERCTQQ